MAVIFSKLFTGGTGFWDVGANITQPIFDGHTLLHRERAAKAAYTQASEQYRSTVLTAFQNVADTLNALQQDANALKAAAAAKDAATVTLDLARKQFQAVYLLRSIASYFQSIVSRISRVSHPGSSSQ
jgi:outer membrane protein TolC